jgi:hypothetical protein
VLYLLWCACGAGPGLASCGCWYVCCFYGVRFASAICIGRKIITMQCLLFRFLVSVVGGAWLVVASWMCSSSLSRARVLPLLRFLLCGVGVVEEDCLVCCLLWRLVGLVWCACFLVLCGAGVIRVGSFSVMSWLAWIRVCRYRPKLESMR